jgi:hypothetical protein
MRRQDGRGYRRRVAAVTDPNELRFVGVSLDCADPGKLADFYLPLLGGRLLWSHSNSAGVQAPGVLLIPQRVGRLPATGMAGCIGCPSRPDGR